MSKLQISLGCGLYDRTRPLLDGRIAIEGCDTIAIPLGPEELFHRSFHFGEFIVSELSMSSYLVRIAQGDARYRAIPVFTSRMFRHSAIYVHSDAAIDHPRDLTGKLVGVPEYAMTAALWVRGFFDDDFGIKPHDLRWRTGGLHQAGRTPKADVELPSSVDIRSIEPSETLDRMLASGKISALISARPPRSFATGCGHVRRLFADHHALERDYYSRTHIFPIMHVVAIRSDYVDEHPWLASSVYKAFQDAKAVALLELGDDSATHLTLPWLNAMLLEAQSIMGSDFWPYGVEENEATLSAMLRYAHVQGITRYRLNIEEIFAQPTYNIARQ